MAQENPILETASNGYDAVMAQMVALRDEMALIARNLQATASDGGQALARDVTEGMNDAVTYLGRKGHAADMRVERAVAENPYIALGLAAGIGMLLGALSRR